MSVVTGIILYFLIYWVAIFCVLPFGNRREGAVELGNVHSAPHDPQLKRKFAITALVATLVWLLIFVLIKLDVIDFYLIAKQMRAEDSIQ